MSNQINEIGVVFRHSRLGLVVIIAVHPFGTLDVRVLGTENYYRITGLNFI